MLHCQAKQLLAHGLDNHNLQASIIGGQARLPTPSLQLNVISPMSVKPILCLFSTMTEDSFLGQWTPMAPMILR